MPSSHLSLHYHLVFSTKHRAPLISEAWREDLFAYLGGIIRGIGATPVTIGGVADHVHLLVTLRATHRLADVLREVKSESSRWARERCPSFGWQDGYGAFTVSTGQLLTVAAYVRGQEEHHHRVSFQDEYRALLGEHHVEFDER